MGTPSSVWCPKCQEKLGLVKNHQPEGTMKRSSFGVAFHILMFRDGHWRNSIMTHPEGCVHTGAS